MKKDKRILFCNRETTMDFAENVPDQISFHL